MVQTSESTSVYWHDLAGCIQQLYDGPWQFIQLRGESFGINCIDGDDVDLLGSRQSIESLLNAAYQWVKQGKCHLRVCSRKSDKVELFLYSIDGQHVAQFDLWINLWQLDKGKQCFNFLNCAPLLDKKESSVKRLPIDIEACVYLQHLVSKGKAIDTLKTEHRLRFYADQCQLEGYTHLSDIFENIVCHKVITEKQNAQSFDYLRIPLNLHDKSWLVCKVVKVAAQIQELCLAAPRQTRIVSIMGCDGAGKTTLAHALVKGSAIVTKVFTGKHLYRKSYIHKAAVIFIRPLLFQSRENFDERLAPLVYLRACLGQRIRYFRQKCGVTIIDRSIIDFLYLNRKTDYPVFSRFSFLAKMFGKRIPTVHCIVSYEVVSKRKLEMSRAGHEKYNDQMYQYFTRRTPTDYLAFNNELSVEESEAALEKIIPSLTLKPYLQSTPSEL